MTASFRTKLHLTEAAEESYNWMKYKIESTCTTDIGQIRKKTGLQFRYDPLRRENFSECGEINLKKSIKKNVTKSVGILMSQGLTSFSCQRYIFSATLFI